MPRIQIPTSMAGMRFNRTSHLVRIFRLTRLDGVVLRFAEHDLEIVMDEGTFRPVGGVTGQAINREAAGRDDSSMTAFLSDDTITDADMKAGKYRGAAVEIMHVDARWPFLGVYTSDVLYIGQIDHDGEMWRAQVESIHQRMEQPVGRLVRKVCTHDVGDGKGCTVNLTPFTENGTVTSVEDLSRRIIFRVSGLVGPDNHYADGFLTFTSGANQGDRRRVQLYDQAGLRITLQEPFGYDIAAGDTFSVHRGCNGLRSTCRTVFGNLPQFDGVGAFSPGSSAVLRNPDIVPRA